MLIPDGFQSSARRVKALALRIEAIRPALLLVDGQDHSPAIEIPSSISDLQMGPLCPKTSPGGVLSRTPAERRTQVTYEAASQ